MNSASNTLPWRRAGLTPPTLVVGLTGLFLTLCISHAASLSDTLRSPAGWRPMKDSPPPSSSAPGSATLEFRCDFAGTRAERSSWDHPLTVDLSSARGVRLEMFCSDTTPVSYFSLYFQSGNGWYHASFFPDRDGEWQRITMGKADFSAEGTPAGWDNISTIRLSAWRGQDKNTRFQVRGLQPLSVLGVDAQVAVLRGEAGARRSPSEARTIDRVTELVAGDLAEAGIECAVLSDLAITPKQLAAAKLVVLPYNPDITDATGSAIRDYVGKGGKVLAFYTVPQSLRPLLNLGPASTEPAVTPGMFSTISFLPNALPGAPDQLPQTSHMIAATKPESGRSRMLAEWLDDTGKATGHAAIIGTTNCILMTHVLQSPSPAASQQMLLAMVGALVPELWRDSIEAQLRGIATLGTFTDLSPLTNFLARSPNARPSLAAALDHRRQAYEALGTGSFPTALNHTRLASRKLEEAFCQAQVPQAKEFRGFWCHSAFGVKGMTWDEAIQRLSTNGFTAIMPNMLWGGAAFYDSQLLPIPSTARGNDQVQACLEACRKYGVQMHVWKVNWNLGSAAPRDFVNQMRAAGRLQVSASGEQENWFCPSHPLNQRLEIESMVEVARKYAVDGLHFDYIRYPGRDHCFCAGCRERFQQASGTTVARWPQDVQAATPLGTQWNDWRRANITTVVKAVSEQARAVRPGIKISAAVFPIWERDRDNVAQDWKLWCDNGYLDFVCPMDYTPSDRSFENMVVRQVKWAGKVPCYPGLGVSASRSKFGADRAIEQILITRKHRTGGYMIFNYGVPEARELVTLLGMGISGSK